MPYVSTAVLSCPTAVEDVVWLEIRYTTLWQIGMVVFEEAVPSISLRQI